MPGVPVDYDPFASEKPQAPAAKASGGTPVDYDPFATEAAPAPAPAGPMPWSDVGKQAIRNLPHSGAQYVHDIVQPVLHPIQTAEGLWDLLKGSIQHVREMSPPESRGSAPPMDTKAFDAFKSSISERYGGVENFKKSLAQDPVGVLNDLSMAVSGVGAVAERLPGMAGKVGSVVEKAGRAVDPGTVAYKVAKGAGKGGGEIAGHLIGSTTGAGSAALKEAYKAGKEGGAGAKDFLGQMRKTDPMTQVVDQARAAVKQMGVEKSKEYRAGINKAFGKDGIQREADPTILSFKDIDRAVDDVHQIGHYKGKAVYDKSADIWERINEAVNEWKSADPHEFHTVEGLDALKRRLGSIRDATEYGKPDRTIANDVYRAVRAEIIKQAPEYAKVMKDYEEASDLIQDVERGLSLGDKSHVDTALRKLQSIMRNNVTSNYGLRTQFGQKLAESGAKTLFPSLAGQALSAPMPRGLATLPAIAEAVAGSVGGHPGVLAALPFASPRLMGEAAYKAGRAGRGAEILGQYADRLGGLPYAVRQAAVQIERDRRRKGGDDEQR